MRQIFDQIERHLVTGEIGNSRILTKASFSCLTSVCRLLATHTAHARSPSPRLLTLVARASELPPSIPSSLPLQFRKVDSISAISQILLHFLIDLLIDCPVCGGGNAKIAGGLIDSCAYKIGSDMRCNIEGEKGKRTLVDGLVFHSLHTSSTSALLALLRVIAALLATTTHSSAC